MSVEIKAANGSLIFSGNGPVIALAEPGFGENSPGGSGVPIFLKRFLRILLKVTRDLTIG